MSRFVFFIFLFIAINAILLLVWVKFELKKLKKDYSTIENSKNDLSSLLSDASSMLDELNNFSDYAITRIDLKNRELWDSLKKFDEKLQKTKKVISTDNVYNTELVNLKDTEEKKVSNVIPINKKYSKVIDMAANGFNETEIAKKLKIGKGEIQIVLGLRKIQSNRLA